MSVCWSISNVMGLNVIHWIFTVNVGELSVRSRQIMKSKDTVMIGSGRKDYLCYILLLISMYVYLSHTTKTIIVLQKTELFSEIIFLDKCFESDSYWLSQMTNGINEYCFMIIEHDDSIDIDSSKYGLYDNFSWKN